jgi:histidinol phosphatase-like PHP family hydrolase
MHIYSVKICGYTKKNGVRVEANSSNEACEKAKERLKIAKDERCYFAYRMIK